MVQGLRPWKRPRTTLQGLLSMGACGLNYFSRKISLAVGGEQTGGLKGQEWKWGTIADNLRVHGMDEEAGSGTGAMEDDDTDQLVLEVEPIVLE